MIKFNETSPSIVISDLKSLYEEIESETNRVQFFIKVAHYGEYIQRNKFAIDILSSLYQEERNDAKPYKDEWKRFVKTWKDYAEDLIKLAAEVGIKDDPNNPKANEIATITNKLNELDKTKASLWETDLGYYYAPYQTLIWKFKDIGKEKLLLPKHIEPKEGMVLLYPHYIKATNEWEKFKYSREAKVWWAHYQICRLAVGVLGMKEKKQYFGKNRVIDAFYKFEFDEVAKGNVNRSPIVLHKHKYDTWIKRLHNFLIPRLQQIKIAVSEVTPRVETPELSKKELKDKISNIVKSGKFGKKEKSFIKFLSKDFDPKTIKEIEEEIGSKAGKQLKSAVKKKIKNTGFFLETIRADKWGGQAQYQLKYLTR